MRRFRSRQMTATLLMGLLAVLAPSKALAGNAEAGKASFTINCATCHGETGKGDGPVGVTLDPKPRDLSAGEFKFDTDTDGTTGTDGDLVNVIKNGAAAYGGSPLMAPWGHLSDEDIANIIAFIRTFKN